MQKTDACNFKMYKVFFWVSMPLDAPRGYEVHPPQSFKILWEILDLGWKTELRAGQMWGKSYEKKETMVWYLQLLKTAKKYRNDQVNLVNTHSTDQTKLLKTLNQ